jgi:hypothetical protein
MVGRALEQEIHNSGGIHDDELTSRLANAIATASNELSLEW